MQRAGTPSPLPKFRRRSHRHLLRVFGAIVQVEDQLLGRFAALGRVRRCTRAAVRSGRGRRLGRVLVVRRARTGIAHAITLPRISSTRSGVGRVRGIVRVAGAVDGWFVVRHYARPHRCCTVANVFLGLVITTRLFDLPVAGVVRVGLCGAAACVVCAFGWG